MALYATHIQHSRLTHRWTSNVCWHTAHMSAKTKLKGATCMWYHMVTLYLQREASLEESVLYFRCACQLSDWSSYSLCGNSLCMHPPGIQSSCQCRSARPC